MHRRELLPMHSGTFAAGAKMACDNSEKPPTKAESCAAYDCDNPARVKAAWVTDSPQER
jgi:hypothetical protein